jgi:hypothetical protein
MDNVVNLAEYRKTKETEELEYLRDLLDEIITSTAQMEDTPMSMIRSDQMEWIDLFPQTNLDGYDKSPEPE